MFPTTYSWIAKWTMWNHCNPWVSHLQNDITVYAVRQAGAGCLTSIAKCVLL